MPPLNLRSRRISPGLIVLVLSLVASPELLAQDNPSVGNALARYIPKDNVNFLIESEGLDAHAEAWQKTAAYKILNNTPTGVMLEEVAAQIFDKKLDKEPIPNHGGKELIAAIKHVARSGFIFAQVSDPKDSSKPPARIFVLRNAFKDKAMRESMRIEFQGMNAPNTKPQSISRGSHKIVSGVNKTGGGFAWWVEESKKEDIVLVFPGPEAADLVLETLDGKRPSLATLVGHTDLLKPESGFTPTGVISFDPNFLKSSPQATILGLSELTKLDYRWGFQENALMSITRMATPGPRKGVLALLDGPGFEKGKLPPIPDSVGELTVVSLDFKTVMDKVLPIAKNFKPDVEEPINGFVDAIKTRTKLRLKEDILAHLGPRMAFYSIPAKAGAKATPAAPGLLGTMMASLGTDIVPRAAVVLDIDDPVAFGKVLDQVMVAVNKELKARAAKAIGADAAPAKGSRNRGPSVPSVEFRLIAGESKQYVMSVPADLASQFPSSFRPAIKVGPKQVVIGVTSEVVRTVLETKGNWAPPADVNSALQGLGSNLKTLVVSDPRDTLPGLLASLPGNLQKGINAALQFQANPAGLASGVGAGAAEPATPNAAGATPMPSPNGIAVGPGRGRRTGGPDPSNLPGTPGAPANPGPTTAAPGSLVLQIDANKLPTADSIKSLLFPSIFAIEVNENEVRIVTRSAFPAIPDTSKLTAFAQLARTWTGLGGMMPPTAPPNNGSAVNGGATPIPGATSTTPGAPPTVGGRSRP